MISWGAPWWLAALWLLPAGAAVAVWRLRDAWRQYLAFAPLALWQKMHVQPDLPVRALRQVLALAAMALVVVALADPRGPGPIAGHAQRSGRLLVLLDVSRSMQARDALSRQHLAISRFSAATTLVRHLLDFLDRWQVGLVVFARDPLVLCPTTDDLDGVATLLERARVGAGTMRQGTDIEQALTASCALLGKQPGAILLLSDGEQLTGDARHAIGLLASRHVPVYDVGFGLAGGTPLVDRDGNPLLWQGQQVVSARNDALLRDLAARTGGAYFPSRRATTADGLTVAAPPTALEVASRLRAPDASGRPSGPSRRAGPLAWALGVLLVDGAIAIRARIAGLVRRAWRSRAARPAAAALVGLLPAVAGLLVGWTWPSWALTRQAAGAYRAGRASESVRLLQIAASEDPGNPVVRFDLANALVATGQLRRARTEYRAALAHLPSGGRLTESTWYNLGNATYELGRMRGAAACYRKALTLEPRDADATYNLALCQRQRHRDRTQTAQSGATRSHGAASTSAAPGPSPPPGANRLLAALEEDERMREAIAAERAEQGNSAGESAPAASQWLAQAARAAGLPSARDW